MQPEVPRPLVSIANISKIYADRSPVIADVSFRAMPGEFVTLLGASGCGKSTLLHLIAGLSSLSGGSIHVDGRLPHSARELMSFVFQDATLLPWRTVAGNIGLVLELAGIPRAQRATRIESVLRLVGLRDARDYYPRQLSGGMKMRVSIARALATTPRLLLMDEPFGALDELTRNRLNEELLALQRQQHWTTLFVTHSITEAVFLSDRILLMAANPGRVMQEIAIPLEAPRTAQLRGQPEFLNLVGRVSSALAALQA
jgi:NitT/TauT family transport system ATP-binding protein